ncbi:MAG: orotidine-5'-phosphate decarboxylase [Clostridiales bacterium]|nr:orotidine-5'-phosphate decarboxylase [Clostridiales bacterium]
MINKLIKKIEESKAPIVVGLDPMLDYIPEQILKEAYQDKGENLEGAAEAIWRYNKGIIDAVYDLIPAVKPQIAMYEQFGLEGLRVYKQTIDYCKEKDLLVIGDIKRGDIGSTSMAYATGHLGKVRIGGREYRGFDEDFITVNPYLGSDGILPFIEVGKEEKKGMFILVKTSNPSSGEFQDQRVGDKSLYELVGHKVAEWGELHMGDSYSYVGAVVGATYPEVGKMLRRIMPKAYILVPGYGAQGGKAEDLVHYFNKDGLGAIVNSSRGIIAAYKQKGYEKFGPLNFADASRQAVLNMKEDLKNAWSTR